MKRLLLIPTLLFLGCSTGPVKRYQNVRMKPKLPIPRYERFTQCVERLYYLGVPASKLETLCTKAHGSSND